MMRSHPLLHLPAAIASIALYGCDQSTPSSQMPAAIPVSATKTPPSAQPVAVEEPVRLPQPDSPKLATGDAVWDKMLAGGLSVGVIQELRSYTDELRSKGEESRAMQLIASLPLGVLRDGILLNFLSTSPLDFISDILKNPKAVVSDDHKILVQALALRHPDENGKYPNFIGLASNTTDPALKEEMIILASARLESIEEWQEISKVEISEDGKKRSVSSAFGKMMQFSPDFLKSYSDDQTKPTVLREEATKWYALHLLDKSPVEAAAYVQSKDTVSASKAMYSSWLNRDPVSATSWMKTQSGTKAYSKLLDETITYAEAHNELDAAKSWKKLRNSLPSGK